MSLGEADAKFPNQSSGGLPPSPSRENPGQVFPKSDPQAAPPETIPGTGGEREPHSIVGNPFAFRSAYAKLDEALNEVITIIESEKGSMGASSNELALLQKFKVWRMELNHLRAGSRELRTPADEAAEQEGGLFTD